METTIEAKTVLNRETVMNSGRRYWRLRRAQDVVLSLIAMAALWPFMLIVALAIVIESPGAGPIFKQKRVGRDGKEFMFYKFRSMIPGAEDRLGELLSENEMQGPVFKMRNDPRITRVGRIIRRCSIDELPQLYNVLRGDMSIVGPRPGLPREVAQYDSYARQRLLVTPGLTCYWQIQPNRNSLTFEEWLELDLKYIKERSFLTDWRIIFATFRAVIGMNGE